MAETKLNTNQLGSDKIVWNEGNLKSSENVKISQIQKPVIDANTIGVWHLENNANNAVSGSSATIVTPTDYSSLYKKFGDSGARWYHKNTYVDLFSNLTTELSGSFTLDCWVMSSPNVSNPWPSFEFYFNPIRCSFNAGHFTIINSSRVYQANLTAYTWYHFAFEKDGTDVNIYINGERVYTVSAPSINTIGYLCDDSSSEAVHLDELRLSNVARYQGQNFTPFSEPYAPAGGPAEYEIKAYNLATTTELATKQDVIEDLADIRSGAALGTTSVQQADLANVWTKDNLKGSENVLISQIQKPVIDSNTLALFHFNNNATNEVTNASRISFVGSRVTYTYLTGCFDNCIGLTNNNTSQSTLYNDGTISIGDGDYTIDFWMKVQTLSNYVQIHTSKGKSGISIQGNDGVDAIIRPYFDSTGDLATIQQNTWHHIALERYASIQRIYIDGKLKYTASSADSELVTEFLFIVVASSGYPFAMDEFRLSDVARYYPVYGENGFTPFDQPYATAGGPAEYEIKSNNLATTTELATKQDIIVDLADIRSGAALGATSVQPADLSDVWTKTNLKQGNHISITQVQKPVIDGNTVALFHFDDSVDDEILTGPSATSGLSAQASAGTNYFGYIAGKFNNALQFGSTTTVNRIFDGFAYSQASTIDFWVKVLNTNGIYTLETYQASSGDAQDHTYKIWFNSGAISIYTRRGERKLTKACTLSDWNHVAIEIYNGNLNFYVNGIFVGSVVDAGLSSGYLYSEISSSQSGGISFDELRISNVARYYPIYGEDGFTPNSEPYAPSDAPAEYNINCELDISGKLDKTEAATTYATKAEITNMVTSTDINQIRKVTQAEYDAMEQAGTLVETTWYLIYTPQVQQAEE